MIDLNSINKNQTDTLVVGNHEFLIQTVLDFDYLVGKDKPSIKAIVTGEDGFLKYFWGKREILIPQYESVSDVKLNIKFFLDFSSGRRVYQSTLSILEKFPDIIGGNIFAENVPEVYALKLIEEAEKRNKLIVGPASVGLVIPEVLKLGAIAGVTPDQILDAKLTTQGEFAVMSASGGMTNELINIVIKSGKNISFGLSFGGDRFPIFSPKEAIKIAESHSQTKAIVYYGELGGYDEYELIEMKRRGEIIKPVIIHIAGVVSELFPQSPQFGHAKAKANTDLEKARIKREKLTEAGFLVTNKFSDISEFLTKIDG